MIDYSNKKLFLLDMDGTIYLDEELFDGTVDFLNYVNEIGGKYIFMTNNSSKSVEKYIKKLKKMGIASTSEDFVTSVNAVIPELKAANYKKIYALGTESFKTQLRGASLPITDTLEDGIDCLCMGFDTELTFKKLEDACILLGRGVDYIATHPDLVCPVWYGFVPDCGSIIKILEIATGRLPKITGKPEPAMANFAMKKTGFSPEETVILGDRLMTDIACGVNAGISSVCLLSGEATEEDIEKSPIKPESVFKNIREFLEHIRK